MKELKTGLVYFKPNKGKFIEGKPTHGVGSYVYHEKSIYTGPLYYDGKRYNKIGFGQQDFKYCVPEYIKIKGKLQRHYLYVGNFDYRKTDWIYGNGVLYYTDEYNNPSGFLVGFFKGLNRVKAYQGQFDYSSLMEGYTKEMEIKRLPHIDQFQMKFNNYIKEMLIKDKKYEFLFIGDSYFDYLRDASYTGHDFDKAFKGRSYLNIAVGGTRTVDWVKFIDQFELDYDPKNIIINIGFNDIHSGFFGKPLHKNFNKLLNKINLKYKTSKIYVFNVCQSPCFVQGFLYEYRFNDYIFNNQTELGITVLDLSSTINNAKENCFNEDEIHLSYDGYKYMYQFLNDIKEGKYEV